jgi:hypothetical protein
VNAAGEADGAPEGWLPALAGVDEAGPEAVADAGAEAGVVEAVGVGPPAPHAATRTAMTNTAAKPRSRDARGTETSDG